MSWSKDHPHHHYNLHRLAGIWINYKSICFKLSLLQKKRHINVLRFYLLTELMKNVGGMSDQNVTYVLSYPKFFTAI